MDQPTDIWSRCLEHAELSDIGLRRANNQDSYAVALAGDQTDFQQRGHLFMVADGMGAHAAGELASKMAADAVSLVYRKLLNQSPPEAILSAFLDANRQIHSRGQASPDFRGMGTTATSLVLLPAGALVAHVGDSRAYRLRGNRIEQLTFDHSLVWELQSSGHLPETGVPSYISKNIITRSLGPNPTVQVDLEGPFPVQAGDTFLLCSDGLTGQVKDDEIGMVLSCLPPEEAVQTLVDLACLRGGPDNITVIVVRVPGPQVAQANGSGQSGTVVSTSYRPVHPLIWTTLGVTSLATIGLLALGHVMPALVCLLGAVGAMVAAMVQRYSGGSGEPQDDGRRFGRGPYVVCDSTPNRDLLGRLSEILRQLKDIAASENWVVDWESLHGCLSRAKIAAEAGKLADAAREYLRAITSLMAQLRSQRSAGGQGGVVL